MSPAPVKRIVVVEDSPMKTFIDRVVVPVLKDRFLAEHEKPVPAEKAS